MKSKGLVLCITALMIIAVITGCKTKTPASTSLPRSTPEAEGVSSEALMAFFDSAAVGKHEFHSIMIIRHGKVIAEGWWNPYGPELRHTLYSTSKSFTSTAVGFAVTEKLLSLDDSVISFFPDQVPDTVSPYLSDMTVKDLLMMSAGQSPDPTSRITSSSKDWVKDFLATPVLKEPGTEFLYNSMATFMLSAIVQKVTGERVADYLQPRLFGPLGIEGYDWEISPKGFNTGGWGLRLKTEDMAKFGLLYLRKGMWNGVQIIPSSWVEEATTFKIDQAPDATPEIRKRSDWMQGYCYQFWRSRNDAFRADGAYGQFIIVMPDKDAVVAITAESPDMQDEINMVWKYILPAIQEERLPEDKAASGRLKQRLASLSLPVPAERPDSPLASQITGKTFILDENAGEQSTFTPLFSGDTCTLSVTAGGVEYNIPFGRGRWVTSKTDLDGPNLISRRGAVKKNIIAGAYGWTDDNTLEMTLRYIESPHRILIRCDFDGDDIVVNRWISTPPGYDLPEVTGTAKP